jgi:hypothetical protein
MDINDEIIIRFWRTLIQCNVRFIMIGGFAVNLYGFSRATDDIDVWVEDTTSNRENLASALHLLKIAPPEIIKRMQFIPGWSQMQLPGGFPLDIMTEVKGIEEIPFEVCFSMATFAEIEELKVPFLHINQLIKAKEATNWEKDKIDLAELKKIKCFIENSN